MIEARQLSKVFDDRIRGPVVALDHVSFTCQPGRIFGLLGVNGAGKTTCLLVLATLLRPSEGTATVAGHDVRTAPDQVRARIGFLSTASGPDKAGVTMPTEAELAAVFRLVDAGTITAYADTLGRVPLVALAPTPSRVVEETRIEEIGVTRWRLANGVQVVLKPTDFKADDILMRARSPGGTSLAPDSLAVSADRASMVVSASGAGAFSDVDLGKLLAGKVARATAFIGDEDEGFSGNASPRDLETMLQLVYLYVTQPRRDTTTSIGALPMLKARTPMIKPSLISIRFSN